MPKRQLQCQLLNSLKVCHGSWVYYREGSMCWLRFLFFLLASQVSAPVVAQNLSHSECVQRELDLIERWESQNRACQAMVQKEGAGFQSLYDNVRCMIRETARWSEMTCNAATRASKKNEILILEELVPIFDAVSSGRLAESESLLRIGRLFKILAEERELGARLALSEHYSKEALDAQTRAAQRYERLISNLGGVLASPPQERTRRYLFRGNYVTCREHGSLTICD